MLIPQDSYKDGKLYYGGLNSRQRLQLRWYRTDKFRELFVDNFPEIYLRLISSNQTFNKILGAYRYKSHFKYIGQLVTGIMDSSLEDVTTEEFETLLRRFKGHLHHKSERTLKELHDSIEQALQPYPQYQ